jgi:hypothetical protein
MTNFHEAHRASMSRTVNRNPDNTPRAKHPPPAGDELARRLRADGVRAARDPSRHLRPAIGAAVRASAQRSAAVVLSPRARMARLAAGGAMIVAAGVTLVLILNARYDRRHAGEPGEAVAVAPDASAAQSTPLLADATARPDASRAREAIDRFADRAAAALASAARHGEASLRADWRAIVDRGEALYARTISIVPASFRSRPESG